ncbi:hypothetical protein C5167_019585 [Papaver somniferum]|uniref:Uncharacterized protein n=1 Tax=Papaver somniferum TaxID=3469 RepID=A0A4Y7IUI8_PAPSO|nr:hypothetical protein C5167_019585 [Papaver somniferum]
MGANFRKFILLGLVFAVVLLISSEVLAVKDLPEKALSEEKKLGTSSDGYREVELDVGGHEVEDREAGAYEIEGVTGEHHYAADRSGG